MTPLEQPFRHEVEFHRLSREAAGGQAAAVHTSYALQHGYEGLIRAAGAVTGHEVEALAARFTFAGDTRDILAARDTVKQLFGLSLLDT